MSATLEQLREDTATAIQEECGEKALKCYQCVKCSAGCPLASEMDYTPSQIMRAIQLGRADLVLNSKTIWVCASCETCSTRCPQDIDIAKIMDTLKVLAQRLGIPAKEPKVPIFCKAAMSNMMRFGRMHELSLTLEVNLRSGQPLNDARLGKRLFQKGKMKLLPSRAKYPKDVKPRPIPKNTVAYYPGCSLHSTAAEFDLSTRKVAQVLGLGLDEPEGWICCGATTARWTDPKEALTMSLKNLVIMEKMGHTKVTVPCAECFSRLRAADHDVKTDEKARAEASLELGYDYKGRVEVEHIVDTFMDLGADFIRSKATNPLSGLNVVCYYGCLLTRPPEIARADDTEYPMNMDYLVRALGAQTLDWSYKTDCCGASLAVTQTDKAVALMQRILQNAQEVGAEAIVVACPLCQLNLDSRQEDIATKTGKNYNLPIFYITQLMGLAFGLGEKEIALKKLLVDPMPLLRRKGLVS